MTNKQEQLTTPDVPSLTKRGPKVLAGLFRLPVLVQVSLFWIMAMVLLAVFADFFAPYDFRSMDLRARLAPPFWLEGGSIKHLLGTDDLGRDMLSRLIISIRISLLVAFLGTIIGAIIGTTLGLIAAHFRGIIDDVVMIGIDFQAALPFMVLALAVVAFFSNSIVLFIAIMGIYGWERYARISRGLALSAAGEGYAVAVKILGASPMRIYARHVLPNIANALIVNMSLNFPQTILMETSLSFLGLGIQPPNTSLGNMVGFGRDHLLTAWWIAIFPAITIFLTTLAMCLLGDWLRDKLDPTTK